MTNKPLIKLLRSPNGAYAYDANRNEILSIQDDSHDYLEKWLQGKGEASIPDEIQALLHAGYFSTNRISRIEHSYTTYLPGMLENDLDTICLQVTQNCNLRCEYCVYSETNNEKQRSHSSGRMSEETMRKAIDFLHARSRYAKNIIVSFYGGEPLLEFPLIKKGIAYAEERFEGRSLTFNITTNGTLLVPEVADHLFAHNTHLTISLDGPKEIHDRHRRFKNEGSFDRLMRNLDYIVQKHPEQISKMNISMVIDPQNSFEHILEVFDQYPFLRKMSLLASIIDDTYSSEPVKSSVRYDTESSYHSFLGRLCELNRLDKAQLSCITQNEVNRSYTDIQSFRPISSLGQTGCPGGPCLPGHRRLFCDINGNLFPCERVSEASSVMNIGTLETGFDMQKVLEILNVARTTASNCKDCWAFLLCRQCARTADSGDRFEAGPRLKHCQESKIQAESFLQHMILLDEIRNLY